MPLAEEEVIALDRYPNSHCGKELAAWIELIEVDFSFIRIWPNHLHQPMELTLFMIDPQLMPLDEPFLTQANFFLFSCLAWHAFHDTWLFAVRANGW